MKKTIPELLEILARRFGETLETYTPKPVVTKPGVVCQYCGKAALHVTGDVIYLHKPKLHYKWCYLCTNCNAYVGCHPDGTPYGELANEQLRIVRMMTHKAFDPIWQENDGNRHDARTGAYYWLSKQLNIPLEDCHIGKFDEATCRKVIRLSKQRRGLYYDE